MFKHSFHFKHPTTALVVGPTQAGKTEFVINLLRNSNILFKPKPKKVIWAYGQKNEKQMKKILKVVPNVEFVEGIPDFENHDKSINTIAIFDDLMYEIGQNPKCANLFIRGSHHDNLTVIAIIHNLFNQQKFTRDMTLNTHIFITFKSLRDNSQIEHFGRQIFPRNKHFLSDAFHKATKKPFGYLVIDLHPKTPDSLRVCSGIFPGELPIIYAPKE
jgi:hypothetical protein